jgi:hypothetical protein
MHQNKPNPIGYVEVQRSGVVGRDSDPQEDIQRALTEAREQAARDYPDLTPYGARVETLKDGAGVQRWNLYMGFAPAQSRAEPLDPRNLNDAKNETIGDPARDNLMGAREQKF